MNRLYKTLLLLIIPGGLLFGQQVDNSNGNAIMQEAQFKTHQMQEQLGLSNEQVAKVYKINLDYLTQLDTYSKNTSLSEVIKQEKIKEINETREKAFNDVLTVTQTEEFKKSQQTVTK